MQIITDIKYATLTKRHCGLTIGTFDGLHLGHLSLLQRLRSLVKEEGILCVYTFTNHPSQVLSHLPLIPSIYTLEHKCKILQENKVDYTILSTFTKELAETPFDQFLIQLKEHLDFSYLVLGEGSSFGKNREGTEERVQQLAKQLHFQVEYQPKLRINQELLSSGRIRTLIAEGKFSEASQCLGRPYSIYAPLLFENEHYHISIWNLCLPPNGTYPIQLKVANQTYIANALIDRRSQVIRFDFSDASPEHHTAMTEVIFIPK